MSNERYCDNCHALLPDEQRFCHRCGQEFVEHPNTQVCPACKKELLTDATFCGFCGTSITAVQTPAAEEKPTVAEMSTAADTPVIEKRGRAGLNIVLQTIALVLTLAALLLAVCPIVKLSTDALDSDFPLNFRLNAVQLAILFNDSFANEDEEAMTESALYETFQHDLDNLYEYYFDEDDAMDEDDARYLYETDRSFRKDFHQLLFKAERINLRLETSTLSPAFVAIIILYAVFFFLAFIAFLLALISWICSLCRARFSLYRETISFIAILFAIACTISLTIRFAFGETFVSTILWYAVTGSPLLLLLVLAIVRLIVQRATVSWRHTLAQVASIAVCAALLFAATLPFFTFSIRTTFDGKEKKQNAEVSHDASIFNSFSLNESMLETLIESDHDEMNENLKQQFGFYGWHSVSEVESGETQSQEAALLRGTVLGYGAHEYWQVFALGCVLLIITVFIACILIAINLNALALGGSSSLFATAFLETLFILFAIITTALGLLVALLATHNADVASIAFKVKVAYGSFLTMGLAIIHPFTHFITYKKRRNN